MLMIDYIPIVLGFILPIIGIMGKNWNEEKIGINKITFKGRVLILLTIISYLFVVFNIAQKEENIKEMNMVKKETDKKILKGMSYILRPLVFKSNPEEIYKTIFDTLKNRTYLYSIGKFSIFSYDTSKEYYNSLGQSFKHPWENYLEQIEFGESLIKESISHYGQYLDHKELILINKVFDDYFFNSKYKIIKNSLLDRNFNDHYYNIKHRKLNPPKTTYLGYYYFNIDYYKPNDNEMDFESCKEFVTKIEDYVKQINSKYLDMHIFNDYNSDEVLGWGTVGL